MDLIDFSSRHYRSLVDTRTAPGLSDPGADMTWRLPDPPPFVWGPYREDDWPEWLWLEMAEGASRLMWEAARLDHFRRVEALAVKLWKKSH
jgi:hypothetical protein